MDRGVLLSLGLGEIHGKLFNFARGTTTVRRACGARIGQRNEASTAHGCGGREKDKEEASANAKNWQRRVASCNWMAIDGPCFVVVCQLCLPRNKSSQRLRRGGGGG